MDVSRRDLLKTAGAGALLLAGSRAVGAGPADFAAAAMGAEGTGDYVLAPLPYEYNALEPQIQERILRLHHGKHHAGYVNGLNETLRKLSTEREDAGRIQALSRDLAFHGSGHVLHTLYWNSMKRGGSDGPRGELRSAIERDFSSVESFRKQFCNAAEKVSANGWAVLAWEPMGKRLLVLQAENHEKLTIWGVTPLMVCDAWEHAYYLQYENRRGDYVKAFWQIIDWEKTQQRFTTASRA